MCLGLSYRKKGFFKEKMKKKLGKKFFSKENNGKMLLGNIEKGHIIYFLDKKEKFLEKKKVTFLEIMFGTLISKIVV